jgi:hypothetical protein
MEPKDSDLSNSKKILQMIPVHIHHETECLKALRYAFTHIRETKELDSLIEEGQYNRSLAELKDLWETFTELEHVDDVLVPVDDRHPEPTLKSRQEYASNILLTSLKLMGEEKNKSISRLHTHRTVLCSLVSFVTALGVLSNFFMYYGICNKS